MRAGHAGLFVNRKKPFDRRMCNVRRRENRHDAGDADPVVRPQRRATGLDPIAVDVHLDPLRFEIKIRVGVLLVHHIEMGLQHNRSSIFHPRRRGLANNHVAHLIDDGLQSQ